MDKTLEQIVIEAESIKDELIAIYNRIQNKMGSELKTKANLLQDLRVRAGLLASNQSSWTCADCIYSTISVSIIPFIESPAYAGLLAKYKALQTPAVEMPVEPLNETNEIESLEGFMKSVDAKLDNKQFVANAPAAIIENERNKKATTEAKIKVLKKGGQ